MSKIKTARFLCFLLALLAFSACKRPIDEGIISVSSVAFSKSEVVLSVGETDTLHWTILPEDALNKQVTFESLNPGVVTVSEDGIVTAKFQGEADVVITTLDGSFTDICHYIVNDNSLKNIVITYEPAELRDLNTNKNYVLKMTADPADVDIKVEVVKGKENLTATLSGNDITLFATKEGDATLQITAEKDGYNKYVKNFELSLKTWALNLDVPEKIRILKKQSTTAKFIPVVNDESATIEHKLTGSAVKVDKSGKEFTITAITDSGEASIELTAKIDGAQVTKTIAIKVENEGLQVREFQVGDYKFKMVYVEPGSFMMGSPDDSYGHFSDEFYHKVTITQGFWIMIDEVTHGFYNAAITGSKSSHYTGVLTCEGAKEQKYIHTDQDKRAGGPKIDWPFSVMKWDDCQTLVKNVNSKITNMTFSLPTEAQWEYAARGGHLYSGYKLYPGSNNCVEVANHERDNYIVRGFYSVNDHGNLKPNELGIYDMAGSVWEWCSDWYDPNYYRQSIENDPKGPNNSPFTNSLEHYRVYRGGDIMSSEKFCRIAQRHYHRGSWWGTTGCRLIAVEKK